MPTFITEDDEKTTSSTVQHDADFILANDIALEEESDEYQRGYMHALSTQQCQYSLRSRNVPINLVQKERKLQHLKMKHRLHQRKEKRVLTL